MRACRVAVVILVVGLLLGPLRVGTARAEINIRESVEWLVHRSGVIVVGRITSHQGSAAASGKSADLVLMTVEITEVLKGGQGRDPVGVGPRCVGVRHVGPGMIRALQDGREEVLMFLDSTVQATRSGGLTCNLWLTRERGSQTPYVVPLARPGTLLLAAEGFRRLDTRAAILTAVRHSVSRLTAKLAGPAARPPSSAFLEVPPGTEAYGVLYSGSACFLNVPDTLFPAARSTLRR